jgi:hypothetical protein
MWLGHRETRQNVQTYVDNMTVSGERRLLRLEESTMTKATTCTYFAWVAGLIAALISLGGYAVAQTDQVRLDVDKIARAAGTKATTTPEGVVRIGWARTDVPVQVDGVRLAPFAGLGSWAAFAPMPQGAMVMGDTVVFQDEVTPAMDAAFAHGLEVTALHNHFFYDEPKVYFMHIAGTGDAEHLAAGVKAVWDAMKKVRADRPQPAESFPEEAPVPQGTVTAEGIERLLGHKSQTQNGVVKVSIERTGRMHDVQVGGAMGLSTWAAFSGSDAYAAVDGDFIMSAAEVQPVMRSLRQAGLHIVALHNHMIGEAPPFYFLHFWGKGPAPDLAQAVKAGLETQR